MPYVITEPCVGHKGTACVAVCPVNAIHPTPEEPDFGRAEQLHIDSEACIHCGSCFRVCPSKAVYPQGEVPQVWEHFEHVNARYYGV